jgi:hypothetical protein
MGLHASPSSKKAEMMDVVLFAQSLAKQAA